MHTQIGALWIPAVIAAVALTIPAQPVSAAQGMPDTLRLTDAVAIARDMNPSLRAAALDAEAAAERISQLGALPDPTVALGLMNWTIDGFSPTAPMSMNSIQLSQRLPWPGKLGFSEERAQHLALAQRLDAREAELRLVARVKSLYFRLASMDRSLQIMADTRDLLRNFLEVASTMYTVGSGLQQDVLQAQVAVARMAEDITAMQQNRGAMAARLNALLGRAATAPILAVQLPAAGGELPTVDSLLAIAVMHRPALAAAHERSLAANAGYRAARRMLYPDFTLTLGYGQRPDFEDLFTVMVGFSIPLWSGSRQVPLRREMQAMESAAESMATEVYNETFARLAELRAEAVRASNLLQLYASSILPQARAAVESALSAYRVGGVDYTTLVQNQMTVNRYDIQMVELTADFHRAVAEIQAIVGGDLEVTDE